MRNNRELRALKVRRCTANSRTSAFRCLLLLVAIASQLLLASCYRRPLEVYYEGTTQVRINVDWLSDFGYEPEQATFLLYKDGDALYRSIVNNDDVYHQDVYLEPGVYKLIVFNETSDIDEFPSLRFENLDSHYAAAVRAKPITTRTGHRWDEQISYMCDPLEPIGCAVDTFTITPEMIEEYFRFIDYRRRHENPRYDTAHFEFNEIVEPMTTKLKVRILIKKGFSVLTQNKGRVEGANISGMADGFYLSRTDRTQETGVLPLDSWTIVPIPGETDRGWVVFNLDTSAPLITEEDSLGRGIDTYGLPFGKENIEQRDSTDNVLMLAFAYAGPDGNGYRGKMLSYNVGKRMRYYTQEGYRLPGGHAREKAELLKHIRVEIVIDGDDAPELPDDITPDDPANANGFDARVDEWEFGGTFEFGGF